MPARLTGCELASFGDETLKHLRACLPAHASSENPVDLLGSAPAELYEQALSLVLADPGVDAAITLFAPASMATADDVAAAICAGARGATKPVAAVIVSADGIPARLVQAWVSCAAIRLSRVSRSGACAGGRADRLAAPTGRVSASSRRDRSADGSPDRRRRNSGPTPSGCRRRQLRALLGCYGLPLVPEVTASDPDQAVVAARELGYPVALKLAAPGLHKTEVGGVALDLRDERRFGRRHSGWAQRCWCSQ